MAPFRVIYVNFLENLDNFLCLMGRAEIFFCGSDCLRENSAIFKINILHRKKKRSKISVFPYEQALPFSFAVEKFYQPGIRKTLIPYFFFPGNTFMRKLEFHSKPGLQFFQNMEIFVGEIDILKTAESFHCAKVRRKND